MSLPLSGRFIPKEELRRRYNAGGFWRHAQSGVLATRTRRDGQPSPEESGEPFCTRSQIVASYDASGERVAVVHQYLRPDGSIGGSGRPEPKALVEGGIIYRPIETGH